MGHFEFNWVTHLGPIYLATLVFVVGALLALRGMTTRQAWTPPDARFGRYKGLCPLLAQSRHSPMSQLMSLLGVKQTRPIAVHMSAY